jgi:hypothetical protein
MPLPQFITRLNWRLIVVHLAACWLFINAFWMFSYLHDPELIAFVRDHRPPVGVDHKHNDAYLKEFDRFGSGRITYTLIWAAYGRWPVYWQALVFLYFSSSKNIGIGLIR